ncbi:epoxide hydrolase [Leptolyngbya sp. Heron Island J]|uniref:alpha/beta fold hydrolase n=1 Tax=Leptolyngbya sp. Heron Island J TaxID=1385935 RepID=UPI0003B9A489|nr:alpha/beta hydrolase [Leptolyngbya sp. Heron Island J]ESA37690.1 epoxide hydrolase [Leptolyngbya sp. Heron Island J]
MPSAFDITTEFIQANGLTFEVDTCGGGPKLALCLHGFPESSYSWRYQLPLLADLGYRVWAPNLRGYGRSSRPQEVRAYDLDCLVEDVAALIDISGATATMLVAHDWGGAIAWMFALQKVRPLERLIIMNLPHPLLFYRGARKFPQYLKSWYILYFQIPWLPEWMLGLNKAQLLGSILQASAIDKSCFSQDVLQVYRLNAQQTGALTAMLNYYRANFYRFFKPLSPELQTLLATPLELPTLMIWGEEDVALSKFLTYGTAELVTDFTLHYLPGVSHWVQQEAPEQVNDLIQNWLAR